MKSKKVATKKPSKAELLKKSVAASNRRIAADNKAFQKMTPAEKRVQIARDVLSQLATKRLFAVSGTWLTGAEGRELFDESDLKKDPELQQILKKTKTCDGCALGGLFLCAVERANKLKISELSCVVPNLESDTGELIIVGGFGALPDEDDTFKYLKKFFTKSQLDLIEYTFEEGNGAVHDFCCKEFEQASVFFTGGKEVGDKYSGLTAHDRMRLIMENIICNKGTFVVGKRPVMTYITPGFVG